MRITRIWADEAGVSHFGELDIELEPVDFAPPAPPFDVSAPLAAERIMFLEFAAGWFGDWHPAPQRQLYFNLGGQLEVEVGDGEVRHFGPGDAALLEDLTGTGHTTRVIGEAPSAGAFVQLREEHT